MGGYGEDQQYFEEMFNNRVGGYGDDVGDLSERYGESINVGESQHENNSSQNANPNRRVAADNVPNVGLGNSAG